MYSPRYFRPKPKWRSQLNDSLLFVALFIITLRPWPSDAIFGNGVVRLTEGLVLIALCAIALTQLLLNGCRLPTSWKIWGFIGITAFGVWVPLVGNLGSLGPSDFIEFLRPINLAIFVAIGYFSFSCLGEKRASRIVFSVLLFVGAIQIPLALAQLFYPETLNSFNALYSSRKIEQAWMRATGVFGNPNHLGVFLIICQTAAIIYLRKVLAVLCWSWFYIGIALTGSVAASIASILLLAVLALYHLWLWHRLHILLMVFSMALISSFVISNSIGHVSLEALPRLERVRISLVEVGSDLTKIHNVNTRITLWREKSNLVDLTDMKDILLGVGPRKGRGLDYLDNEVLFILFRHGLVGLTSALMLLVLMMSVFGGKRILIARFGVGVVLLFLFLTPIFEIFSLWRFMAYYSLPFGAVVGLAIRNEKYGSRTSFCRDSHLYGRDASTGAYGDALGADLSRR